MKLIDPPKTLQDRLRNLEFLHAGESPQYGEAADEIDRLLLKLNEEHQDAMKWSGIAGAQTNKANRLEEEVLELRSRLHSLEEQDEVHWKTRRTLLTERDALREDLDRLTKGTWSKEIARVTAVNLELRSRLDSANRDIRNLLAIIRDHNVATDDVEDACIRGAQRAIVVEIHAHFDSYRCGHKYDNAGPVDRSFEVSCPKCYKPPPE